MQNRLAIIITTIAILGIAVLLILRSDNKTPDISDVTVIPVGDSAIKSQWPSTEVKKEVYKDSGPRYHITAEYPVTGSDLVNRYFKSFIDEAIASFKENMGEETASVSLDYDLTLDITYKEEKSGKVDNYTFTVASDTGGAHGIVTYKTFSFLQTGERVTLLELFTNGADGLATVSELVKADLSKREFADKDWIAEGAAPTIDNYQSFVLSDDGVTFIFDPYQVAAYAAGTQIVHIPVAQFKSIANPDLFTF